MGIQLSLQVPPERIEVLEKQISDGSEPHAPFYVMTAVSTGLAAFGLAQNSTAVVIGAMLVAPLMTPIFGLALSLVQGDARLMGRASTALIAGVVLSILVGTILGFIMPGLEPTPAMLARAKPNLFDLAVALLAGFAGAYALVDEKLSATLPGVAIAVAIVPPLANAGLSISLGTYVGAWGSFLLFSANFFSILLVASAVFVVAKLVPDAGSLSAREVTRRFGLAALGFVIVAVLLAHPLYRIVIDRRIETAIETVLREELQSMQTTQIEDLSHHVRGDTIYVMAHVYSPRVVTPTRVADLEAALSAGLGGPARLFVRSTLSRDVSATGHVSQVVAEDMDGFFYAGHSDPEVRLARVAEQVLRERFAESVGISLDEVSGSIQHGTGWITAWVSGIRPLGRDEVQQAEDAIASVTDLDIRLTILFEQAALYDRYGGFRLTWTGPVDAAVDSSTVRIMTRLDEALGPQQMTIETLTVSLHDDVYHAFAEAMGPRALSQQELIDLATGIETDLDRPLELYVRFRPEIVQTEEGPVSFESLERRFLELQTGDYPEHVRLILEAIQ